MNIKFKTTKSTEFFSLPIGATFRSGLDNQHLLMKIRPLVSHISGVTITYNAINLNTTNLCDIYISSFVDVVYGSWIEE